MHQTRKVLKWKVEVNELRLKLMMMMMMVIVVVLLVVVAVLLLLLLIMMAVFWVVVPCSMVEVHQLFRGACCHHHEGNILLFPGLEWWDESVKHCAQLSGPLWQLLPWSWIEYIDAPRDAK